MNSYKYLLKNIGLFTIGQFASKFITFFMLPLYTYYLTTDEYAIIDLIQTSQGLVIPIITLSIAESVLCYSFYENEDLKEIFSIGFITVVIASVVTWIVCFFARSNDIINEYFIFICISMTISMLNGLLSNFARALDRVRVIVISSSLTTLITALINILLVAYLHIGIKGYFIALIIGALFNLVYLCISCKIINYITFSRLTKKTLVKMLKLSIPLIPNGLFWWVNASIDKYFLTAMTSLTQVGLYSVANKIPALGNTIMGVFNTAWRMSTLKEDNSDNKEHFFVSVYEMFSMMLMFVVLFIIVLVKPLAIVLFSKDFYQAWYVVPFLVIGFYYTSLNAFIGNLFVGAKITKILFTTTVYGAVVNIILNLFMIPKFGIIGAAIATMISNGVVFEVRLKRAKQWLKFSPKRSKQLLSCITAVIVAVVAYIDSIILYPIFIIAFIVTVLVYKKQLICILNLFINIIKHKKI